MPSGADIVDITYPVSSTPSLVTRTRRDIPRVLSERRYIANTSARPVVVDLTKNRTDRRHVLLRQPRRALILPGYNPTTRRTTVLTSDMTSCSLSHYRRYCQRISSATARSTRHLTQVRLWPT